MKLNEQNIEDILDVEIKTFIPVIQAPQEVILYRLDNHHIYLGAFDEETNILVGTLGFRQARFVPKFSDFIAKYPNFDAWANALNEANSNAFFVYSLGVLPQYRNGFIAKSLVTKVVELAKSEKMDFLVGDARIPSYNGIVYPGFEEIKQNQEVKTAIDESLLEKIDLTTKKLSQDPILGFYLKIFPELKILGVTDSDFLKKDYPAGGHRVIIYEDLRK